MNKYKKTLRIAPLVGVLSTTMLFAPGTSFAAEQPTSQAQQVSNIKGYIIQNGTSTPVLNTQSEVQGTPLPVLPENPYSLTPQEGKIKSDIGKPGKWIYFNKPVHIKFQTHLSREEVEKEELKASLIMDEQMSGQEQNSSFSIRQVNGSDPTLFEVEMVTDRLSTKITEISYLKDIIEGTKLIRDTQYKLLSNDIMDRSFVEDYSVSESAGLTNEDSKNFALTIGASYSGTVGGGVLPASATATYSASLEASFGTRTTVSSEKTVSKTFRPNPTISSYKQDDYVIAIYQLHSTYKLQPGSKLQQILDENAASVAASKADYKEEQLYATRTPGSGTYKTTN